MAAAKSAMTGTISIGSLSANVEFHDGTLSVNQEVIDVTVLGGSWKKFVPGLRSWELSGKGVLTGTTSVTSIPTTTVTVTITDGFGVAHTGTGILKSLAIEVNVEGAHECTYSVQGSDSGIMA